MKFIAMVLTLYLLCEDVQADVAASGLNSAPALATTCTSTLTAELTQGPYYLDDILFRSNITETETGIPVTLNVYLLDTDCNPVVDAFISIWHANATGVYSGFTGAAAAGGVAASQTDELTFLRGLVMTDVNGLATFETIFPGRYTGRTPHIHAKAFVPYSNASTTNETARYEDSHMVHTGQFFNTDLLNTYVQTIYPYSSNTQAGDLVKLSEDNVYTSDTEYDRVRQVLSFSEVVSGNASAGLIASIDAIVNTSATYSNVFSKENDVSSMSDTSTSSDTSSSGSWGSRHVAATVLIVLVCLGAAAGAGFVGFKRFTARSRQYTLYDTNVQMSST